MITPWHQCEYCGKIVKVNKAFFGSLHICVTDEEAAAIDAFRARQRLTKRP